MGETIAKNKKAYHDYSIEEKFEAGIVLKGSEIKAIRAGRVNLKDSFIRIDDGEVVLFNAHIGLLDTTHHYYRHEERGARKLLLHKKEIVKLQIAIAKGKKLHDKRQDLKEKDQKRDIARAMKDY